MKTRILASLLALIGASLFTFAQAQSDINQTGYTQTFDDEFNTLGISTANPKGSANWYAGPANGPTGDFSNSNWNSSALTVTAGVLSDQAWSANPQIGGQNWQSGILESVDPSITGFTQKYGY